MNSELDSSQKQLLSREEQLQLEFNRNVPVYYDSLIAGVRLYAQPEQTSSDALAWDIFRLASQQFSSIDDFASSLRNLSSERIQFFETLIRAKDFVNLGSGDHALSPIPYMISKALGARRHIGVDRKLLKERGFTFRDRLVHVIDGINYTLYDALGPSHTEIEDGFISSWIQDDMLGFVSKIPDGHGATFFLAGIDDYQRDGNDEVVNIRYFDALWFEMSRAAKAGDAVIFSGVMPSDHLIQFHRRHGFREFPKSDIPGDRIFRSTRVFVKL